MAQQSHRSTPAAFRAALACVCAMLSSACAATVLPVVGTAGRPAIRIVFVGDSLLHRSGEDYRLFDLIREELARRHPYVAIEVVDAAVNGNRIADVRERLRRDVLDLHPAAVVLYWDSDVSDVDEGSMRPDEVRAVRAAYEGDTTMVAKALVESGAYVVMSGPTLIGERPRRRNQKDTQLNAYRNMNRRIASSLKITYIDTRRAFFAQRPPGMSPDVDRGLLTEDGEHLNARGVSIVQALFVQALDAWLLSYASESSVGSTSRVLQSN
jgi:dipeptidyl aminopeptidase/acylaminoacyl peptidase